MAGSAECPPCVSGGRGRALGINDETRVRVYLTAAPDQLARPVALQATPGHRLPMPSALPLREAGILKVYHCPNFRNAAAVYGNGLPMKRSACHGPGG